MPAFGALRFTFALPDPDPREQSKVFQTALEMVRYGEDRGIIAATVDEHHASGFGWSPNPILEAGMLLAATSRLTVSVMAALGPLYNPVRLVEDIAVVDQSSSGRLSSVCLGLGYRPIEYAAMGLDFHRRAQLFDELLEVVLAAWSGEPFEHHGATIQVSPRPLRSPQELLQVGGAVEASARRALRFGLPFQIPDYVPEVKEYYEQLCREHGVEPMVSMSGGPDMPVGMTFLAEDPEKAWAELGKHFVWEAVEYGAWATPDMRSVMHLPGVKTAEEVRASGKYRILSPQQLIDELETAAFPMALLYPMCGGMPIEAAWECLHLFTEKVKPHFD